MCIPPEDYPAVDPAPMEQPLEPCIETPTTVEGDETDPAPLTVTDPPKEPQK